MAVEPPVLQEKHLPDPGRPMVPARLVAPTGQLAADPVAGLARFQAMALEPVRPGTLVLAESESVVQTEHGPGVRTGGYPEAQTGGGPAARLDGCPEAPKGGGLAALKGGHPTGRRNAEDQTVLA